MKVKNIFALTPHNYEEYVNEPHLIFSKRDIVFIKGQGVGVILGQIDTKFHECRTDLAGMVSLDAIRFATYEEILNAMAKNRNLAYAIGDYFTWVATECYKVVLDAENSLMKVQELDYGKVVKTNKIPRNNMEPIEQIRDYFKGINKVLVSFISFNNYFIITTI
jgi:hypothetical protein